MQGAGEDVHDRGATWGMMDDGGGHSASVGLRWTLVPVFATVACHRGMCIARGAALHDRTYLRQFGRTVEALRSGPVAPCGRLQGGIYKIGISHDRSIRRAAPSFGRKGLSECTQAPQPSLLHRLHNALGGTGRGCAGAVRVASGARALPQPTAKCTEHSDNGDWTPCVGCREPVRTGMKLS